VTARSSSSTIRGYAGDSEWAGAVRVNGSTSERAARSSAINGAFYEKARAEVRSDRPEGLAPCFSKSSLRLEALNDTTRFIEKPATAPSASEVHRAIVDESRHQVNMQAVASTARSWRKEFPSTTVLDSQLQRIHDSVEFLGTRDDDEEFEQDLDEMTQRANGRASADYQNEMHREQRCSKARALIKCGLIEQGEQILRDINYEAEQESRAKLAAHSNGSTMPRFLTKSKTAEVFDKIFNAKAGESSSLEGDLERERMNALRETRKEVEQKWQTSFHTTALQHTRDMWKLEHDSVDPSWGAVGGARPPQYSMLFEQLGCSTEVG